jgi:PIN domain nuclease of toxin-antitoxin system
VIVLDTHALVWWVSGSTELSLKARRAIRIAIAQAPARASTMSVFEIASAVRRGRLGLGVSLETWLTALTRLPDLAFEPISREIAQLAAGFDDSVPRDPADRLIAATALALDATLVTRDDRLRKSPGLKTLW